MTTYIIVALCIAVGACVILYNAIATPKQQAQALSDLVEESLSDAEDMRAHEFQANHAILHTDDPQRPCTDSLRPRGSAECLPSPHRCATG